MKTADARAQWEGAAAGWARWEATVADWMEPATEAMLQMARVSTGGRVLDLACGAGSQTLRAAQMVGAEGHVAASDIADAVLFLCGPGSRMICGQTIVVDGGFSLPA